MMLSLLFMPIIFIGYLTTFGALQIAGGILLAPLTLYLAQKAART